MSSTTRAFFLCAWDNQEQGVSLIGPFETRQLAYNAAVDNVGSVLDDPAAAIVGPIPFEQLREGGEWIDTIASKRKLWGSANLPPPVMIAAADSMMQYPECASDVEALKDLYHEATGEDMPAPYEPLVTPEQSREVMAEWAGRKIEAEAPFWAIFETPIANERYVLRNDPEGASDFDSASGGTFEWCANVQARSAQDAITSYVADGRTVRPQNMLVAFPLESREFYR